MEQQTYRELIAFLQDVWLPDGSQRETLEFLLEDDLIDLRKLRRHLLDIARDFRADAAITTDSDEKEYLLSVARRAEQTVRYLEVLKQERLAQ